MLYNNDCKIIEKAELSDDEYELILKYRSLSPEMKAEVIKKIRTEKQTEKFALR